MPQVRAPLPLGYGTHSAAQDHSYVADMWQRFNPPDVLIYLDVTLEAAQRRGQAGTGLDQHYLNEQRRRLRHARLHCDFYLPTEQLSEEEVVAEVVEFLQQLQGHPGLGYNRAGRDGTSRAGRPSGSTAKEGNNV